MGEIFIEGLGVVELEGDTPNAAEMEAITSAVGDPDDGGDPGITMPGSTLPTPKIPPGIGLERTRTGKEPAKEGPLGLMPVEARARTRGVIESQPGLVEFVTEMTPATIGAGVGAAAGSVLGPAGTIGGGMIGGAIGELFAQETGLAPSSELNMIFATGGPLMGAAAGQGLRGLRRGVGFAVSKAPFAKAARARNVMGRVINEWEDVATQILSKQKGLMQRGTTDLYTAASKAGVKVKPETMKRTIAAIEELADDLAPISGFDEVNQAQKVIRNTAKMLLENPDGIGIGDIIRARKFIGRATQVANRASGGETKVAANKVFAAMSDDLEAIASTPFKKGRQARLAQAAIKRAKLGFSTDKLEQAVTQFTKEEGDQVIINFKGLQNWLSRTTNPKSKTFDKNFTEALKDEIPRMKEALAKLAEIGAPGSPGGPGALVVRGQGAKIGRSMGGTLGGAILGANVGGPVGAGLGAVAGAQLPEMLVAGLTTKGGAAALEKLANLGKAQISSRAWSMFGELVMRSLGEKRENVPFSLTPEEATKRLQARGGGDEAGSVQPGETGALETAPAETEQVGVGNQGQRKRTRLPPEALERISREIETGG